MVPKSMESLKMLFNCKPFTFEGKATKDDNGCECGKLA
jgi:hypothetical protein